MQFLRVCEQLANILRVSYKLGANTMCIVKKRVDVSSYVASNVMNRNVYFIAVRRLSAVLWPHPFKLTTVNWSAMYERY